MERGLGWEGRCVVIGEGGIVRVRVSPGSSSSRRRRSCRHGPGRVCRYGVMIRDVVSLLEIKGLEGLWSRPYGWVVSPLFEARGKGVQTMPSRDADQDQEDEAVAVQIEADSQACPSRIASTQRF